MEFEVSKTEFEALNREQKCEVPYFGSGSALP
jgi:hypothetical protein